MNFLTLTFSEKFRNTLTGMGIGTQLSTYVVDFFSVVIMLAGTVIIYYLLKIIINRGLKRLVQKSSNKWDDYLYEEKVFTRMALLVPPLILEVFIGTLIESYPGAISLIHTALRIYMTLVVMLVITSFLKVVYRIYGEFESSESKPLKSYLQVGRITVYLIGGVLIVSILVGQSPLAILAGLGAVSAVLLLIFRDSLLGLVAGVQISTNDMLQVGDWITLPGRNIDGVVLDITLVIVKVRNFDNSLATIPTYTLISEGFQNWRKLAEHGGRRIKRHFLVDADSIRFTDGLVAERLRSLNLSPELMQGEYEQLTNLGLFRKFLTDHLRSHGAVNQNQLVVVRQLQPTETGIPVEVHAFSVISEYPEFERFQSQLFEYIFASLPLFGLRVYQRPSQAGLSGSSLTPSPDGVLASVANP